MSNTRLSMRKIREILRLAWSAGLKRGRVCFWLIFQGYRKDVRLTQNTLEGLPESAIQ